MLLPSKSQLTSAIQLQKNTVRRYIVCYNYPIKKVQKKRTRFYSSPIFLEQINQIGIITTTQLSNMIPSAQENSNNNFYFFEV